MEFILITSIYVFFSFYLCLLSWFSIRFVGSTRTSFLAGSAINVTWHLAYPHRVSHLKIASIDFNEMLIWFTFTHIQWMGASDRVQATDKLFVYSTMMMTTTTTTTHDEEIYILEYIEDISEYFILSNEILFYFCSIVVFFFFHFSSSIQLTISERIQVWNYKCWVFLNRHIHTLISWWNWFLCHYDGNNHKNGQQITIAVKLMTARRPIGWCGFGCCGLRCAWCRRINFL